MENFFIYSLKSCGLLIAFWLCFRLFLKRETFFQHHRFYLIIGAICSLLLPFWQLKKTVIVEPSQFQNLDLTTAIGAIPIAYSSINWFEVFLIIYLSGFFIFTTRFILQFVSLKRLLKKCIIKNEGVYKIVTTSEKISPFSFFNTIVYNPEMYDSAAIKAILVHEKIHVDQKHSIDSIIGHLICIMQWMNPIVWFYKKDMEQNLEFIADKNSVTQLENKKEYQYLLLHQSGHFKTETTITNPFFNSLIKKRIAMLNQLKSKQINLIKYSVIVPIMVVFLVFFNTKTVAQVKESNTSKKDYQAFISEIKIEVDMNTTDEALEEHSAFVKEKVEVYLKFNKIKRNKKGEIIAINSTYKSNNGSSGNYKVTNNKPIEPFVLTIDINKDGTTKTLGFSSEKKEQENSIILIGKKDEEVTKLIGNTSSSSQTSNNTITEKVKSDNIKIKYKFKNYNDPNTVEQIELPASSQNYSWFTNEDNSKPLVFIDGKESNIDFNLNSIKPEDIAHINILKGEGATFVYGEKAKNGVIEITLKEYPSQLKTNKEPLYIVDNKEVISLEHIGKDDIESMFVVTDKEKRDSYGEKAKNGVVLVTLKKEKLHDDKNPVPLFVVDGKIVDTIENLKKKNIKSLTVLKNEAAVSKYGEEGKNGVIEIITKKN